MSDIVILHISDLHFGIENDVNAKKKYVYMHQREAIDSLISSLKYLEEQDETWKVDVIAITGDISWTGQREEYQLYKETFVKPMYDNLGIKEEYILTCPGNHDFMLNNGRHVARPIKGISKMASNLIELNVATMDKSKLYFNDYVDELYSREENKLSYTKTFEEWPWISFLVLNSAWDCRGGEDEGTLRIGLPIVEKLLNTIDPNNCIVTMFHHPHTSVYDIVVDDENRLRERECNWLHLSERYALNDMRTVTSIIEQNSQFILNGHIHKKTDPKITGRAINLISGTLYSKDVGEYHCRIIKISENDNPSYRDIINKSTTIDDPWSITMPKSFNFQTNFEKNREKANEVLELVNFSTIVLELTKSKDKESLLNRLRLMIGEKAFEEFLYNYISICDEKVEKNDKEKTLVLERSKK